MGSLDIRFESLEVSFPKRIQVIRTDPRFSYSLLPNGRCGRDFGVGDPSIRYKSSRPWEELVPRAPNATGILTSVKSLRANTCDLEALV
jgi:hypothetical protein